MKVILKGLFYLRHSDKTMTESWCLSVCESRHGCRARPGRDAAWRQRDGSRRAGGDAWRLGRRTRRLQGRPRRNGARRIPRRKPRWTPDGPRTEERDGTRKDGYEVWRKKRCLGWFWLVCNQSLLVPAAPCPYSSYTKCYSSLLLQNISNHFLFSPVLPLPPSQRSASGAQRQTILKRLTSLQSRICKSFFKWSF